MKNNFSFIIIFLFVFYGQSLCQNTPDWIYEKVSKNIIAFEILARSSEFNNNFILPRPFFEDVIPDKGCVLDLKLIKSSIDYPLKDYLLYACELNRRKFDCSSYYIESVFNHGSPTADTVKYFVAIDSLKKNIKFISGFFFLSDISKEFNDLKSDKDLISYLQFRLLAWEGENLTLVHSKKKKKVYTFYSKLYRTFGTIVYFVDSHKIEIRL